MKFIDPIKVLHVVTYMDRGGLETMIMNYYRHIDKNKVQFDFLVHRNFEADYDKEIISLGGEIYHLPRLNPFSYKYLRRLDLFFKNHQKYKIVHVHQDCMSAFPLLYAKKAGVPIRIAHSHNSNQNRDLKYPIKMLSKQFIPMGATHFFACGVEAGKFMFGNNDFKIMRNAIETEKFLFNISVRKKVRHELKIKNNVVIGNVANFSKAKNHLFLLEIFYEYHKFNSQSKLLLVGDGPERRNIENKIEILGLNNDVILIGVRSDVNRLLQAMDVFVFPSLYEGLPVTLIEAQAAGLPIIKSDNVPDQCIITNNVHTLSLEESPRTWAKKILEVYINFERKNTSSEIISAGYDITSNAKWLEDFYLNEVRKIEK